MGGETAADDPAEEEEAADSMVWVPVERDDGAKSESRPADDRAKTVSDTASQSDTETVDPEALIAEDPADGSDGDANEETGRQDQSPREGGPDSVEPHEDHAPGKSTDGGSEPPAEKEEPDRLWNRLGQNDPSRDQSGESADSSSKQPASDRNRQRSVDESDGKGREPADADTTDGGRVWNSEGSEPAGSDGSRDSSITQEPGSEGTATTGSGAVAPAGGDKTPEQKTRFDNLLEQSGGGSGQSRPVGSPSVETDLDAFFSDLDEFDQATSGSQVLVISPRGHSITDEVCSQFLTAGGTSERNTMFVTAEEPPSERVEICRNNDDWTGGKVAVIELGNTGSDADQTLTVDGEDVMLKRVNSPKNLSKTGLLITQTLKKWPNSDRPSIMCFHTLTAISGYIDNETLFQFLFTLQAKLNSFGVTGHYHMDAGKHDDQDINTLKTLFDLVVTISQNGEIEVE